MRLSWIASGSLLVTAACTYDSVAPVSITFAGAISVDRSHGIMADGVDHAVLTVTVEDSLGDPVPDYTVRFAAEPQGSLAATALQLTSAETVTDSDATATAALSSTAAGEVSIVVTLGPVGEETILADQPLVRFVTEREETLELRPGGLIVVGASPYALALADLDANPGLDLVTANWGGDAVAIINNAGGIFGEPRTLAAPTRPRDLVVADFDGDGILDLTVALAGADQLLTFFGSGDGSFESTPVATPTESFPRALVVGDLTGDGRSDVVVANANAASIELFAGSGQRADPLQWRQRVGVGLTPSDVVMAGFDGDEGLDLAVACTSSNSVSLLLQNPDGELESVPAIAATAPVALTAADFDGDGRADLVIASADGVAVHLQGDGGLGPRSALVATDTTPGALAVGDLNSDGLLDLAVTDLAPRGDGGFATAILLGTGQGSFDGRVEVATGDRPVALAIGDIDGDGRADLAVASFGLGTVSIHLSE